MMGLTLRMSLFFQILFLVLVLEPIVALPWLTRRDITWDDSPGQALIDIGVFGLGALNQLWNQWTIPSTETVYPPDQKHSEPGTPNTPEWLAPPLFEPNTMKKCPASTHPTGASDGQPSEEGDIPTPNGDILVPVEGYMGIWVQQNIETGRPLMETCDAPDGKPEDAYLVQEIRFAVAGTRWEQWPSAILVSDVAKQYDIRYDLERKGGKMVVRKVSNYKFLRKNAVVELGYYRRHGWLVGAGQPKEAALSWFDQVIYGITHPDRPFTVAKGPHDIHFTAQWLRKVLIKLSAERSPHWVPLSAGSILP